MNPDARIHDTVMQQHEDQQSIARWAAQTFGEAASDFRIATRVNEELAEMLRAIGGGAAPAAIIEEAADTLIVLARFLDRNGGALHLGGAAAGVELILPRHGAIDRACDAALSAHRMVETMMTASLVGDAAMRAHCGGVAAHFLCRAIALLGGDPQAAVDAKMAINRQRRWKKDGSGHGYHIRTRDPGPARSAHDDILLDARKLAKEIDSDVLAGEDEIAAVLERAFEARLAPLRTELAQAWQAAGGKPGGAA